MKTFLLLTSMIIFSSAFAVTETKQQLLCSVIKIDDYNSERIRILASNGEYFTMALEKINEKDIVGSIVNFNPDFSVNSTKKLSVKQVVKDGKAILSQEGFTLEVDLKSKRVAESNIPGKFHIEYESVINMKEREKPLKVYCRDIDVLDTLSYKLEQTIHYNSSNGCEEDEHIN